LDKATSEVSTFLKTSIEYLKGVGPSRAELFQKELGVFTYVDLLNQFPFRYLDRTKIYQVRDIDPSMPHIQLKGKLQFITVVGSNPGNKRLTASFVDDSGSVDLVWFKSVNWLKDNLKTNTTYILFGKPSSFNNKINIAHPELELEESQTGLTSLHAVYPSTDKLKNRRVDNRLIRSMVLTVLQDAKFFIREYLPSQVLKDYKLISNELAYKWIHHPTNPTELKAAQDRIKFNEFFVLQCSILRLKKQREAVPGIRFGKVGDAFNSYYQNHLSFELTNAQKRVIKEIHSDLKSGIQMNRLLQGDVGSGKSIVAFLCALIAIDNGFQVSIMAPTEILANQHFNGFKESMNDVGVQLALLTGSVKKKDRTSILAGLADGSIHILIGTHALIEDPVIFKNQGLVIIDEQHRFGVAQRAKMWHKSDYPPHILVMTATPIPRTLAMTVYGDLEVSKIDELPGGRKPIITAHRYEGSRLRVRGFVKEQVDAGRQVYIVFPLIEESETLDYKNLQDGFDHLLEYFERPTYQIEMMHGRMKPADKDAVMQRFKEGKTQILVSTTVIEVGINVPNATVMVIESSEKFGLAQLHQLRGRVGRGADQSFCVLMTGNKLTKVARQRLTAMVDTTDGFEIAEFDLKLRGPGDIEGTRQSGLLDLKLASLTQDGDILAKARLACISIFDNDPDLKKPENMALHQYLGTLRGYVDWSRVS
jgi:ATP-dependent DNA helicase RecG